MFHSCPPTTLLNVASINHLGCTLPDCFVRQVWFRSELLCHSRMLAALCDCVSFSDDDYVPTVCFRCRSRLRSLAVIRSALVTALGCFDVSPLVTTLIGRASINRLDYATRFDSIWESGCVQGLCFNPAAWLHSGAMVLANILVAFCSLVPVQENGFDRVFSFYLTDWLRYVSVMKSCLVSSRLITSRVVRLSLVWTRLVLSSSVASSRGIHHYSEPLRTI